ncbi:unnamed protein product [Phytophthora fragariaefolia]|uniref:Unnamed protein product n=1 Tax=Phytophthora fragariaefolia TaxID=1490495 RepID=A0A9W7CZE6_9STRA|nr:unnamed protein product [Phytophthora fragariaefolia]
MGRVGLSSDRKTALKELNRVSKILYTSTDPADSGEPRPEMTVMTRRQTRRVHFDDEANKDSVGISQNTGLHYKEANSPNSRAEGLQFESPRAPKRVRRVEDQAEVEVSERAPIHNYRHPLRALKSLTRRILTRRRVRLGWTVRGRVETRPDMRGLQYQQEQAQLKGYSPGNVTPEYPFQMVLMDFVIPLPVTRRGNTALLLFQDHFTGFVIAKAMSETGALEVAKAFEECVFRRFGAPSLIRHDRDPRFMSEVFQAFAELMPSRSRATLSYRPQANGQQERSVKTMIQTVRAYVEDPLQADWDDIAEKMVHAINNSRDTTRRETPFYHVHGWDAQSTLKSMTSTIKRDPANSADAAQWRREANRQQEIALQLAKEITSGEASLDPKISSPSRLAGVGVLGKQVGGADSAKSTSSSTKRWTWLRSDSLEPMTGNPGWRGRKYMLYGWGSGTRSHQARQGSPTATSTAASHQSALVRNHGKLAGGANGTDGSKYSFESN